AGDEKPELARGGAHSIAQVLQRAYVHSGGQIRAVHHVEKILVADDGRATACAAGGGGRPVWPSFRAPIHTRRLSRWSAKTTCRALSSSGSKTFSSMSFLISKFTWR